jgi:hypothetical protein
MSGHKPFVVVVAGVAEKVGKSTIANNLAVYLKALGEDLPVTLISFTRGAALDEMFSLKDGRAATVVDLLAAGDLARVAQMGQFGVFYLSAREQPQQIGDTTRLRRILARDNRGGIVIFDAGNEENDLWRSAVWAADLVLAPIGEHRSLAKLSRLRRALAEGGGQQEMLWLLPSQLGEPADDSSAEDVQALLRFAADERGYQVLKHSLSADRRVHLQATGQNRTVLTRLPGSHVHGELRRLAEFVLRKYADGPDADCQGRRMLADGLLPRRARRVDLVCPLCALSAIGPQVHYLEALPGRYRALLHAECLENLLQGTGMSAFLPRRGLLLVETGVAGEGLRNQIRLLLPGERGGFAEQELLLPESSSGWDALLRAVTGRSLNEQEAGVLVVSGRGEAAVLLGPGRYRLYQEQKRNVLHRLRREEF